MLRCLLSTVAVWFVASACGDSPAAPDAGPDAAIDTSCERPPRGTPGGRCSSSSECGRTFTVCYQEFAGGYCEGAPCDDAPCGDGEVCGVVDDFGVRRCLPACNDADAACECPTGMVCSPTLLGTDLGAYACVPGDPDATDGSPCESASDCHDGDWCWRDDLQAPGGVCMSWGCRIGDSSTCAPGGDGVCAAGFYFGTNPAFSSSYCIDTCVDDRDCRQGEGYRCRPAPPAELGLMCRATWVGDPCATDEECGAAPWRCVTDGYPGGYCTIDCGADGDCPTDAACDETIAEPFCRRSCATALDDCRAGYTCGPADGRYACLPDPP